jgi:hypothetical protein
MSPLICSHPRDCAKMYLTFAREAIDHASRKLVDGRANDVVDVVTSLGASRVCVHETRKASKGVEDELDWLSWIHAVAHRAERSGCGNCGECAAMAFHFLEARPVRPLEYMTLAKPGDHAFVVIGRPLNSKLSDVKTWGAAVICDAWDRPGKAYPAHDVQNQMYANGRAMIHLAEVGYRLE